MNLERLKRFVFLAGQEVINLNHSAKQLHLPQPYLSRDIRQLEDELGKLFVRNPRLKLTPYGEVILKEAQHLIRQVEQFQKLSQQADRGEIGRLNVGINTSISNSLLPDILRVFRQKFPNVDLVFQELLFKESRRRLQDRTIDVDFDNLYNLQDVDDRHFLMYEVVNQEQLVMVLPEEHPLAHYPQVQLQDFAGEPFVLPSHDSVPGLHILIRMACMEAGFHPKVVQFATWMPTVLSLVAGEIGVALLPANVMNRKRSGVVYQKIQGKLPMYHMAIVWRREDNQSKILSNFLNVAREVSCQ